METPVVLLIFNRPDLTARVLEVVRLVQPAHLLIVADGPRSDVPTDLDRCRATRAVIEQGVDWPCELVREYSDANLGCALRVSSGLDFVFSRYSEAIIIEDDCLADPTFFRFCSELLERYRDDDRIAAISGDNFQMGRKVTDASYYFSRYPHCWGWATWRRAWKDFDFQMKAWPGLRKRGWLRERVQSPAECRFWRDAFDRTADGRMDSWAFRWTFACWLHGRATVLPAVNLVSNVGYRSDATHTVAGHPVSGLETQPLGFPLQHPEGVTISAMADARTADLLFRRDSLRRRIVRRIVRAISS